MCDRAASYPAGSEANFTLTALGQENPQDPERCRDLLGYLARSRLLTQPEETRAPNTRAPNT